jgi:hypothetical protein
MEQLKQLDVRVEQRDGKWKALCPDGTWLALGIDTGSKRHEANLCRDLARRGVDLRVGPRVRVEERTKDRQVADLPVDEPDEGIMEEEPVSEEMVATEHEPRHVVRWTIEERILLERKVLDWMYERGYDVTPDVVNDLAQKYLGERPASSSGALRLLESMVTRKTLVPHADRAQTYQLNSRRRANSNRRGIKVDFTITEVVLTLPMATYAELLPVLEEYLMDEED